MLLSELITLCKTMVEDEAEDAYTSTQWISAANDAQRSLMLVESKPFTQTVSMLLSQGSTKQSLGATHHRMISIIRNTGVDGLIPGRAIRGPISRSDKDLYEPNWHTETASVVTNEYVFDDENPREFWVSPPAHATTAMYVEGVFVVVPTTLTAVTDAIAVGDIYAPALREWMLYITYARDNERTPNWNRAGRHFMNFFQLLGKKVQKDLAISPKVVEYAK